MDFFARQPLAAVGALLLAAMVLVAVCAPWLGTVDPQAISPARRLRPPSASYWFGTDMYGRDVYSRCMYGARISLIVGGAVAFLSMVIGSVIGLAAGYSRAIDAVVTRVMDALMAIPDILLAICLMALTRADIQNVILAITITQIPRVVRLVRSVTLSLREQLFVEAAVTSGATFVRVLARHILPNAMAPLLVQGTYICASAMITEAILSFIGAGTPPEVPSWGNMMAEGRSLFQAAYHIILFPGLLLASAVLAVNLVGDGLRDTLDPRLSRRL
ncbi:ABC transporter permease [Castellaniella sp. GW247-6E4]|uniref:ABC transporter permease n=1 Tax=Castellaniella sp. GW247-6E4 TaxID=3140380 RepID=UPI0033155735